MKDIESEFVDVSVVHLNMRMYYPKDAIRFINRCKELNKRVLGIDAFIVKGEAIQPSMENSVDYSILNDKKGHWNEAEEFVKNYINKEYVFEIVYK